MPGFRTCIFFDIFTEGGIREATKLTRRPLWLTRHDERAETLSSVAETAQAWNTTLPGCSDSTRKNLHMREGPVSPGTPPDGSDHPGGSSGLSNVHRLAVAQKTTWKQPRATEIIRPTMCRAISPSPALGPRPLISRVSRQWGFAQCNRAGRSGLDQALPRAREPVAVPVWLLPRQQADRVAPRTLSLFFLFGIFFPHRRSPSTLIPMAGPK
jgi:hypothetical protein